jgi:hypothetical protein
VTLGDGATRALLAVVAQERPTVRSVAAATGRSLGFTHERLRELRKARLVAFEDRKQGTLRALVTVPNGCTTGAENGTLTRTNSGPGDVASAPGPWPRPTRRSERV